MTEEEWLACEDPRPMIEYLLGPETVFVRGEPGYEWNDREYHEKRTTDRKLRLFAVACCRRIWPLLTEKRSQTAVEIGERYADGNAEEWERDHALDDASFVYRHEEVEGDIMAFEAACWPVEEDIADVAIHAASCAAQALAEVAVRYDLNEQRTQCYLVRDIFGNPFRVVAFDPTWRSDTAVSLARGMYESRDFSAMPILADALQDAGCDNDDVLNHCRDPKQVHVRGCWVVDLVLGLS